MSEHARLGGGTGHLGEPDPAPALADLLVRCASGDERAFEGLYGATASRVFGLVLRLVVQHSLAEEVARDVFACVWAESSRFEPSRGSAIGWVLTIAHRRAVDRVRSISASRTRDDVWSRKVTDAPFDSTAESAHSSFEAARVRGALAALTVKQRTALQLAYFHGLTYPEVAVQLGIPQSTAKTGIRDGLRSLASALDHVAATA